MPLFLKTNPVLCIVVNNRRTIEIEKVVYVAKLLKGKYGKYVDTLIRN